jgi:hypothetical protein
MVFQQASHSLRKIGNKVNSLNWKWFSECSFLVLFGQSEKMMSWHHSGFHVYIDERIWPEDEKGLENLARDIIRACFSQERMVYIMDLKPREQ